jgi:hypothetical protein
MLSCYDLWILKLVNIYCLIVCYNGQIVTYLRKKICHLQIAITSLNSSNHLVPT